MVPTKIGLITRNTHVKYQSSSTHYSKVISKDKVFIKWVKSQGQGHGVKIMLPTNKVLSQEILMWNIKALAFTVQKLLARLKFQREWQNYRQDKNNMPPDLRSRGHKTIMYLFFLIWAFQTFVRINNNILSIHDS